MRCRRRLIVPWECPRIVRELPCRHKREVGILVLRNKLLRYYK